LSRPSAGIGKRALVTGAAGGIGRSLAVELAAHGYALLLVDRDEAGLEGIHRDLGNATHVEILAMDLARPEAAQELYGEANRRGQTDLLVNNVGFGLMGEHIEQSPEALRAMITLNNMLPFELCLRFGRDMKARGAGQILNVASLVGFSASPYFAAYSGTKASMLAFSVALAREMADYGVSVTCLCPGTTETGFLDTASIDSDASRGMRSFASAFIATPDVVARAGVKGLLARKIVVVPTAFLKVQAAVLDMLPATFISGFVQRKIKRSTPALKETSR
jgi:uncharacterized protein